MKIELKSIDNFVFNDTKELQFTGVIKSTHRDCDGNEYKLESNSEKYLFLDEIFGKRVFITETYLLQTLLSKEIEDAESGNIYDHGYPEARLIPQNHYEDCNDCFLDSVKESFNEKIDRILRDYMQSREIW